MTDFEAPGTADSAVVGGEHPVVMIFPYLWLDQVYEFGSWWIGPAAQFPGPWNPPELEQATRLLLSRYVIVTGTQVTNPTLIANLGAGAGTRPDRATADAVRLAIGFGVLCKNPTWPYGSWDAWNVIAADNVDLWAQPIDLGTQSISLQRGARIATMAGGHNLGDDTFTIPPPLELPTERVAKLDIAVASAVYDIAISPERTPDEGAARRLVQAIRWWIKAWANSASITDDDRIVFYKTALDTLMDSDRTNIAGERLTALFGALGDDELRGVLWQPNQLRYDRHNRDKTYPDLPAIEHWVGAFGDARNDIAHRGRTETVTYTEADSPYNGPVLAVADRVIREAILARIAELGHSEIFHSPHTEAIQRLLDAAAAGTELTVFEATATPAGASWRVTVDGHPDIGVTVADLGEADAAVEAEMLRVLGYDPGTFEIHITPVID